jgi:membrane-associated phospholipid phosphatase
MSLSPRYAKAQWIPEEIFPSSQPGQNPNPAQTYLSDSSSELSLETPPFVPMEPRHQYSRTIGKTLFSRWHLEDAIRESERIGEDMTYRSWVLSNAWTGRVVDQVCETGCQRTLDDYFYNGVWRFTGDLYTDFSDFFALDSLIWFGLATGTGAAVANTSLDDEFRDWYLSDVQAGSPDFSWGRELGEAWLIPPLMAVTWGVTEWFEANPFYRTNPINLTLRQWSRQSLRALIVGSVPVIAVQYLSGASRPGEVPGKGSDWDPFDDNNGVSSHAAIGAVPFLVAAYMSDHWLWKSVFFCGSFIASYARIYEDRNYLSQVFLGWSYAALAVESTIDTEQCPMKVRMVPLTLGGTYGVGFEYRW